MMIDTHEHPQEGLGYLLQVAEGQVTFIELSVEKDVIDDLADDALQAGGARILERARSRLGRVCDHDDARFFRLWLGPGIAELFLSHFTQVRVLALLRL